MIERILNFDLLRNPINWFLVLAIVFGPLILLTMFNQRELNT